MTEALVGTDTSGGGGKRGGFAGNMKHKNPLPGCAALVRLCAATVPTHADSNSSSCHCSTAVYNGGANACNGIATVYRALFLPNSTLPSHSPLDLQA